MKQKGQNTYRKAVEAEEERKLCVSLFLYWKRMRRKGV